MLDELVRITRLASERILEIYETDFSSQLKEDFSPVTPADHAAHETIVEELYRLDTTLPVLSEESDQVPFLTRSEWSTYWLVDPLDGTKGFIDRSGQFTVNIALIDNGEPVIGVVGLPVADKVYCGDVQQNLAYVCEENSKRVIKTRKVDSKRLNLVESRHHPSRENKLFNRYLKELGYELNLVKESSSLKFCAIAEGKADLFLRFGPTSEWDIGAPQAVLVAAGGAVQLQDGSTKRYNQTESLLNPPLLSFGDTSRPWVEYLDHALLRR